MWSAVVPPSERLAYVLTGDRRRASVVARRTYVRVLARFLDLRDPSALEILSRRSVVRQTRRRTGRDGVGPPLWRAFLRLRRRRRAAAALWLLEEMDVYQIGDVLGCSAPAVRALLGRALDDLKPAADVAGEVREELRTLLRRRAEEVELGLEEYPAAARRARRARAATAMAALVLAASVGAGSALGTRAFLRADGGDVARVRVDLAGDDSAPVPSVPEDLSPSVTPGWCPPARRLLDLHPDDRMGASTAAMTFGVSLGQDYRRSIANGVLQGRGIPPADGWPRPQSGRLRVLQSSAAGSDALLVEDCGSMVARRTWKVVMREFEERETNNVFVVYLGLTTDGWKAWATLVGVQ